MSDELAHRAAAARLAGTQWIGVTIGFLGSPMFVCFLLHFVAEGYGTPAPNPS